jgi:Peptidase family M23
MSGSFIAIGLQIALPLGLLIWFLFAPARDRLGFWLQAFGTGLALAALGLVALWSMPPWWLPYLYGVAWLAVFAVHVIFHATPARSIQTAGFGGWLAALFFCALGVFSAYLSVIAIKGRQPAMPVVADISTPLGPGAYFVAQGGSNRLINGHLMTLDPNVERFKAWRGQSYGVDMVKIDTLGLRASGWLPEDPAAYAIYGTPIRAACMGTVISAGDGNPDMPVPITDRAHMLGNHVIIDCGQFILVMAHMQKGSVRVNSGDQVKPDTQIGKVGNSGNSTEPHLHIHAQATAHAVDIISGEPLALTINGRFLSRNDRFHVE